ncbi:EexN family lipoprotein [Bartonella sp. WD12.1]|uniref:EexN family lipoprotein n=1 Tax=Bartonella sp. WD12.1 TaxID=1933903 RepID=UPI00099AEE1D|nr:EexN family lipoprotein [Bartonella sp. WD12.1]OPB28412.1 hypothetical protein BWD121_016800 [Bartonella sp. WD12.1]
MKKIIMTTLLLCTGFIIAGCEKTYSVEEFKKNKELRRKYSFKCLAGESSKNCEAALKAIKEIDNENMKKAQEKTEKQLEENRKKQEERRKNQQRQELRNE